MYVKIGGIGGGKSPTKHKKCPKGQHWNVKSRKCMKLPADLRAVHNEAVKHHKAAKSLKKPSKHLDLEVKKNFESAKTFANAHTTAGKSSNKASKLAKKHGFHALAKSHANNSTNHHYIAWQTKPFKVR